MNRFTFTMMNHRVDKALDSILRKLMKVGIRTVTREGFSYIDITFNDGSKMTAWDHNKYYAWLRNGAITHPNNVSIMYNWDGARPKKSTMVKLCKMLGKITY